MIQHLGYVALQNFIDYSRTNRFIQQLSFVEQADANPETFSNRTNFDIYGAEFNRVESVSNMCQGAEFSKDCNKAESFLELVLDRQETFLERTDF